MNLPFIRSQILSLQTQDAFEALALEVFRYQAEECSVYKDYLRALKVDLRNVDNVGNIPFLPIEFWKHLEVKTGDFAPETVFTSSSTSGMGESKHFVQHLDWYRAISRRAFEDVYGPLQNWVVMALLPAYMERSGSSLVWMAEDFIAVSSDPKGGTYLYDHQALLHNIQECAQQEKQVLLLGVTFALLDFAEYAGPLPGRVTVMETGGMKGRRREMVRAEVHDILTDAFKVNGIHSEYGMTELMSQAYSKGNGLFHCPPWMRVSAREMTDPLSNGIEGKTGGLNVIDLANLSSCCFIATQDVGVVYSDSTFEVRGRFDQAEVRGCNLMVL